MKKIIGYCNSRHLFALTLLLASTCVAEAASPRFAHIRQADERAETPAPKWVPGSLSVYNRLETPDATGSIWGLDYYSTMEYDNHGNMLVELSTDVAGERSRVKQTYNANGRYTSKITEKQMGPIWTKVEEVTRKFDDITGVEIEHRAMTYEGVSQSFPGNCFNRVITRDEQGRITKVEIQVLYSGIYDPTERIAITYGENGQATEIRATSQTRSGSWVESGVFSNIVWENTNGQITGLDGLFQGDNRIKSAHYHAIEDGVLNDYDITATYTEGNYTNFSNNCFGTLQGKLRSGKRVSFTQTDDNGSYKVNTQYYTLKENDTDYDWYETYYETYNYDAYGNDVLVEVLYSNMEDSRKVVEDRQKAEVTYDPEHGYPTEMIVSLYDIEGKVDFAFMKITYGDYIDANTIPESGIQAVGAAPGGKVEWFDLSGRRVSSPAGGIFIRKQGNDIQKVKI